MSEIYLNSDDNLLEAIKKIKEAPFNEVILIISSDSPLWSNSLNLRILEKEAVQSGKTLQFNNPVSTENPPIGYNGSDFGFKSGTDIAEKTGPVELTPPKINHWKTAPAELAALILQWPAGVLLKVRRLGFILPLTFGFIILAAGGAAAYWYLPSARIILEVDAETLAKSVEVEASVSAQTVDKQARIIPAAELTATREEKAEASATGKKEIGDSAAGSVVIYNKTDNTKLFPKGSLISKGRVDGGDLRYLLDQDVTVPARTATVSAESVTYFSGKIEVPVTAEKIGEEYNLTKGLDYIVVGYSTNEFIAQGATDFTGGRRRFVKIATAEDQANLSKSLRTLLEEKLLEDLDSRLTDGQRLEKGAVVFKELKEEFSQPVGAETEKFSLDLSLSGTGIVYNMADLQTLVVYLLGELVPAQYDLASAENDVEVFAARLGGGGLLFTAKGRGFVTPRFDRERIRADLAGQPLEAARQYLSALTNLVNHRIELWPPFPLILSKMPYQKDKIQVEVVRR